MSCQYLCEYEYYILINNKNSKLRLHEAKCFEKQNMIFLNIIMSFIFISYFERMLEIFFSRRWINIQYF